MLKRTSLQKLAFITLLVLTSVPTPQGQNPAPQLGKNSVREVIAAMTTEEKVKLLVGMGFNANISGLPQPTEEDRNVPEKVAGAAGRTRAIPRLGIPSLSKARTHR